jgi:uncharacterized delta-60 repeat protein
MPHNPNSAPIFFAGRTGNVSADQMGQLSGTVVLLADGKRMWMNGATIVRDNPDGSPDLSFHDQGRLDVLLHIDGQGIFMDTDNANVLSDGRILVGGTVFTITPEKSSSYDEGMAMVRLLPDGSLDPSFGAGTGAVVNNLAVNALETPIGTFVTADGHILIGMRIWEMGPDHSAGQGDPVQFGLARLTADGTLDTTFGNGGIVLAADTHFLATSMALQADGKVIVAGIATGQRGDEQFLLYRFNADGSLDHHFGVEGHISTPISASLFNHNIASNVTIQADGKIVVTGTAEGDSAVSTGAFIVLRYHPDGSLDKSFSGDGQGLYFVSASGVAGHVAPSAHLGRDDPEKIVVNDDGTIMVSGIASHFKNDLYENQLFVIRLRADGTIDRTYGNGGAVTTAFEVQAWFGDMIIEPDGSASIAGSLMIANGDGISPQALRVRFDATGQPDQGYGNVIAGASNSALYLDHQTDQFLNPHLQVTDAQLSARDNYAGASVSLTLAGATSAQSQFVGGGALAFVDGKAMLDGVGVGTVHSAIGSLRIDFNGNATQARVNDVLQSIAFHRDGVVLAARDLSVHWTFSDGNSGAQGEGGAMGAHFTTTLTLTPNPAGMPYTPNGSNGNDYLGGRAGNDTLDGGSGIDTAAYGGNRASYVITQTSIGVSVYDKAGTAGTDTLISVERLHFKDGMVAIDIDGNAGQAYRLYRAVFDREADAGGLGYWIDALDSGMALGTVATAFIASPEFATLYGTAPDATEFVDLLYQNVMHRDPDSAGLAWWVAQLATGTMNMAEVLIGFSESADNQAQVIGQIEHGIGYLPVYG